MDLVQKNQLIENKGYKNLLFVSNIKFDTNRRFFVSYEKTLMISYLGTY